MRTSPLNCLLDALPRADTPPLVGEPGAVHPGLRGRVGATGDERLQPQQGHAPGTHRPPQGLRQQPPRYTQSGSRTVGRGRWPSAWASLHRKPRGFSWPARQRTVRLGELSTRHACSMVLSLTSGPGRRKRMRVVGGGSSACVVRVRGVSCPSRRGRKVLGSLDYRWARGIVRRRTGHGLLLGSWLVPHRPRPPDRVGRISGLMRYGGEEQPGVRVLGPAEHSVARALFNHGLVRDVPHDRQVVADEAERYCRGRGGSRGAVGGSGPGWTRPGPQPPRRARAGWTRSLDRAALLRGVMFRHRCGCGCGMGGVGLFGG